MNTTNIKAPIKNYNILKSCKLICCHLVTFSLGTITTYAASAGNTTLTWSDAMSETSGISKWLHTILLAIMACFIMVSIILGSLAFKQLSADGDWKSFWSKIAGAIGMFVTPIAIYWIAGKSNG